jgi:hypothetical protein
VKACVLQCFNDVHRPTHFFRWGVLQYFRPTYRPNGSWPFPMSVVVSVLLWIMWPHFFGSVNFCVLRCFNDVHRPTHFFRWGVLQYFRPTDKPNGCWPFPLSVVVSVLLWIMWPHFFGSVNFCVLQCFIRVHEYLCQCFTVFYSVLQCFRRFTEYSQLNTFLKHN